MYLSVKEIAMRYRVRDWEKFKHFKDRNAPWVKLNKELLNNKDWFGLQAEAAKTLVMLWLVASEDPEREGNLPELGELAFRLRMEEPEIRKHLDKLGKWLEQTDTESESSDPVTLQPDIIMIPQQHHAHNIDDTVPEMLAKNPVLRMKHGTKPYSKEFSEFWSRYPKKLGKTNAYDRFTKITETIDPEVIIAGLRSQLKQTFFTEDPEHFTFAETWLNQRRWEKKAP